MKIKSLKVCNNEARDNKRTETSDPNNLVRRIMTEQNGKLGHKQNVIGNRSGLLQVELWALTNGKDRCCLLYTSRCV